jgi:predicted transcriptional regulator
MDSKSRLLFWLLSASRGGPTRAAILSLIYSKPLNTRQIAIALSLDYKTVKVHIELLKKYQIIDAFGGRYGQAFFISPEWENNEFLKKILKVSKNEKK